MELNGAIVRPWLLCLLTAERLIVRRIAPTEVSLAETLRIVRQLKRGQGGRPAARNLNALKWATKNRCKRKNSKHSRNWPHEKNESPPKNTKTTHSKKEPKTCSKTT